MATPTSINRCHQFLKFSQR